MKKAQTSQRGQRWGAAVPLCAGAACGTTTAVTAAVSQPTEMWACAHRKTCARMFTEALLYFFDFIFSPNPGTA